MIFSGRPPRRLAGAISRPKGEEEEEEEEEEEKEEEGEKKELFSVLEGAFKHGFSECAVARPTFFIERISLF